MAYYKKDVTLLVMHLNYVFLILTHGFMLHAALFLYPKLRCIDVTDLCMRDAESVFMWKIIVLYCRVVKQIFIYVVSSPIIYEKFMWKIVIHGSKILFCG